MKAVILAAGRGKRMMELTKNIPKTLLHIHGKQIIFHTLTSLPQKIEEVIIVVGYLGSMIKEEIGSNFNNLNIRYVDQMQLGTAGALWSVKDYLENEPFLVLNADDLYDQNDLTKLISFPLSFGLSKGIPPNEKFLSIETDNDGYISGSHRVGDDLNKPALLATGSYVLDKKIFSYNPVLIRNNELGLPQTIFKFAGDYKIMGVIMENWVSINNERDLREVQK